MKGHYEQLCGKLPQRLQPKNVKEIDNQQYSDTDQNTGKIQSNVDIVNMIRSLGLHEQCEAKRDNQLHQKLKVHEVNIFHGRPSYPVFKAPVFPTSTNVVWDTTQDVMNLNVFVATEKTTPVNGLDVITVHDVKSKCAIYSYCAIAGQTIKIKQYTGAEVNVMSKHVFKKISNGVKTQVMMNKSKTMQIKGYGKNPIGYLGTCRLSVKHNDVLHDVLFFITDIEDDKVILGAKACQQFKLVEILCDDHCFCKLLKHEVATVNEEFPAGLSIPDKMAIPKPPPVDTNIHIDKLDPKHHILQLFPDLFQGVGMMEDLQVHLDVNPNIEPVVQAPRKIPHSMLEPLKTEIERMLKLGVICKLHINEAMDWVHNLVLVRKPNGKLCVCLDPRTINKALRFNINNARMFPEITSQIRSVKYVSKIDANSGFWTLPMDPAGQIITTFNTPWGQFYFLKMPFGLNQLQYFFQFWIDTYFGNLNEGTHVITDDVKIHGEDESTHDQQLIQVLNQCRKVGLKLNLDKCIFKLTSMPFFGHVISDQGVKPDPAKMDAIKNMPTPMSKHKILSFLGLCNYLSVYVPNLSSILKPLRELTKKNTMFIWNTQYKKIYQCAKKYILYNTITLC